MGHPRAGIGGVEGAMLGERDKYKQSLGYRCRPLVPSLSLTSWNPCSKEPWGWLCKRCGHCLSLLMDQSLLQGLESGVAQ